MHTPETTIQAFWSESYKLMKLAGGSFRTVEDYESQVNIFDRIYRALQLQANQTPRAPRLADLTDENVAAVMRYRLQEGRSPATANGIHKAICALWRYATKKKILNTLPEVELFPTAKRVRSVPTPAEFEAILEACLRTDYLVGKIPARIFWPALICMDVNTGVRVNALMSIRRQDLDMEHHRVLVRGEKQKHRADQWFDLLPRTVEFLQPMAAWRSDLLFPWPYDNKPGQWQTLRRHFRRILKANGLPDNSERMFHCFRRYCATRITREVGIEAASQYLGHSCLSVTRGYVDPLQGVQHNRAAAAFPELMGGGGPTPPPAPVPPPPTPGGPQLRVFTGDLVAG